jgi:hypothetical protein
MQLPVAKASGIHPVEMYVGAIVGLHKGISTIWTSCIELLPRQTAGSLMA